MKLTARGSFGDYYELFMTALCVWGGAAIIVMAEGRIGHDLGPHLYGDYKIALLLFYCIGQTLVLGTDNITLRELPPLLRQQQSGSAKFLLYRVIGIVAISSCSWGIISLMLNHLLNSCYYFSPAFYYLGFASIWAFVILGLRLLRAAGYTITSIALYYSYGPLLYISIFGLNHISLEGALIRSALCYSLISAVSFGILYTAFRKVKPQIYQSPPKLAIDAGHYTLQQLLSFPTTTILLFIAKLVALPGSEVGILAIVFMLAGLVGLINMVVKSMYTTRISLAVTSSPLNLKQLLRNIYLVSLLLFCLACLILHLLLPAILAMFGSIFSKADHLLALAIVGVIPSIVVSGDTFFLNYHKFNKYLTRLFIFKSLLTIITGAVLISYFAIYGAIYSYILVEFAFGVGIYTLKSKALKNHGFC